MARSHGETQEEEEREGVREVVSRRPVGTAAVLARGTHATITAYTYIPQLNHLIF